MPELVPTFAAIDCGTNAIRLLIAAVDSNKVSDRLREMRTVRLGEGVDATGEFSNMALERTFAACREYAELLMQYEIKELRFVATSASRDVSNRDVFITGVKEILGVEPEVISGDQEAELSYRGALSGLDVKGSVLVADIGGGSTEFVTTLADRSLVSESVNIGCVRMTERYLQSDPPTQQEVEAATRDIRNQIELIARTVPIRTETTFIGLAGSVTTVAAMALGLHEYDADLIHGSALSMEEVDAVTNELLHMTRAQRAELGFMHPGRVDVIGGGALVLRESMRLLGFTQVVVSEKDLLDGVVIALKNT
ncbi:MAG: Ppx/GppA family phosphatase [Actinomycetales bacterium]|jgi:exopolyphosphatase / guanosine-5'-triphosphate,3'-diphosphate pyrophosphatase|nr:Ppx/GppA family phosphatase [Actinomycetales bacterium]